MALISSCWRAHSEAPVTIFREFRNRFLRGRPLDLESDSQVCEGRTAEIFVSRLNLFEDAMDEILSADNDQDLSVALEVMFAGECAQDYGGPRRELLTLMIREIHERLFVKSGEGSSGYTLTENTVHADKKCYFGAGLIFGKTFTCSWHLLVFNIVNCQFQCKLNTMWILDCLPGLSLLQGGPLPCFMDEDQMQRLFLERPDVNLNPAEVQFQEGVAKFGLVEVLTCRSL